MVVTNELNAHSKSSVNVIESPCFSLSAEILDFGFLLEIVADKLLCTNLIDITTALNFTVVVA